MSSDNEMTDEIDAEVEGDSVKDASLNAKPAYEATAKEASFFFSVLKNCKSKPDVSFTFIISTA
jgi:hypothetical protein